MFNFTFFFNNTLLGAGLAMDAFSVSVANGLKDPDMKLKRALFIAFVFALFQGVMPLIGWVLVSTVVRYFKIFQKFIPWIALILLLFIGIKMLLDGCKNECELSPTLSLTALLVQAVATSIDALSVGFTIASYSIVQVLVAITLIALVTFIICFFGVKLGSKLGCKFSNKATAFGGAILIFIGLEIFITGIL